MSQSTNSQSGIWTDVVTVQQGGLLPNPWTGEAPVHPSDPLLNAPTVSIPLQSILGAGPQGKIWNYYLNGMMEGSHIHDFSRDLT